MFVPLGYGRKQPVKVVLVDISGEEGEDAEKRSGVRAGFLKHGEEGASESSMVVARHSLCSVCSTFARCLSYFPGQSSRALLVVMCNRRREEGDGEWMKFWSLQDVLDNRIGPFTLHVR